MLRGGSGRHFRVVVPPGGASVELLIARNSGSQAIDPALVPRLAVVRIS